MIHKTEVHFLATVSWVFRDGSSWLRMSLIETLLAGQQSTRLPLLRAFPEMTGLWDGELGGEHLVWATLSSRLQTRQKEKGKEQGVRQHTRKFDSALADTRFAVAAAYGHGSPGSWAFRLTPATLQELLGLPSWTVLHPCPSHSSFSCWAAVGSSCSPTCSQPRGLSRLWHLWKAHNCHHFRKFVIFSFANLNVTQQEWSASTGASWMARDDWNRDKTTWFPGLSEVWDNQDIAPYMWHTVRWADCHSEGTLGIPWSLGPSTRAASSRRGIFGVAALCRWQLACSRKRISRGNEGKAASLFGSQSAVTSATA